MFVCSDLHLPSTAAFLTFIAKQQVNCLWYIKFTFYRNQQFLGQTCKQPAACSLHLSAPPHQPAPLNTTLRDFALLPSFHWQNKCSYHSMLILNFVPFSLPSRAFKLLILFRKFINKLSSRQEHALACLGSIQNCENTPWSNLIKPTNPPKNVFGQFWPCTCYHFWIRACTPRLWTQTFIRCLPSRLTLCTTRSPTRDPIWACSVCLT